MGSSHLTADTLAALVQRRLPPDGIADALRHLESCSDCRANAAAHAGDPGAVRAALTGEDVEHLDLDADLIPYVDGAARPDQIEIVESHVEDCATCRAELDDLLALRGSKPRRSLRWLAIAASFAIAALLAGAFFMTREMSPQATPQAISSPAIGIPTPVEDANPEWTRLVTATLSNGRLPFPSDLASLHGTSDALRSSTAAGVDRVAPAGVVIDEPRPEFSWPPRGESFVVLVFDGETEVARSDALRGSHWKPQRDLRRGRTYSWQVEATTGAETDYIPAPPAPPAMFRIAGEEDHRAIAEALRARPEDHILHAALYARAGLRAEALASLRAAGTNVDARRLLEAHENP